MMKIFASFIKFYITASKHTFGKREFSKKLEGLLCLESYERKFLNKLAVKNEVHTFFKVKL